MQHSNSAGAHQPVITPWFRTLTPKFEIQNSLEPSAESFLELVMTDTWEGKLAVSWDFLSTLPRE